MKCLNSFRFVYSVVEDGDNGYNDNANSEDDDNDKEKYVANSNRYGELTSSMISF